MADVPFSAPIGGRRMTDAEYAAWAASSEPMVPMPDGPMSVEPAAPMGGGLSSVARTGEIDPRLAGLGSILAGERPPPPLAAPPPAVPMAPVGSHGGTVAPRRTLRDILGDRTAPAAVPGSPGEAAPISPAEAALWAASERVPALGSGSVSLPTAPTPGAGGALDPALWAAEARANPAPAGDVASAARLPARRGGSPGGGDGRAAPTAAPMTPEESNAAFIDELTNRPTNAVTAERAYDNRAETPLARDQRMAAEMGRIETRRAEVAGMAAADERDRIAGELAARQQLETERSAAMAEATSRMRNAYDRAAAMTLDPDGFYHSRGVGGTIGATIAIALGAIGSGINGGPNQAAQMIAEEIDRDLQAQAANIDSAFRRADAEGGLVQMMGAEFENRTAALEASRALALEDAAARVAEEESRLGATEANLNAEALRSQLSDAAAAARSAAMNAEIDSARQRRMLEARIREREANAARAERRAMGGGGPAPINPATPTEMDAFNRGIDSDMTPEVAAAAAGIDPRLIPPSGRFAEASAGDSAANVAALSAALDEIEALVPSAESGGDAPGVGMTGFLPDALVSDDGRQLREALANTNDLIGRLRSGGAISQEELVTFRNILSGAGTDESLRRGITRIRREIDARTSRTREGRTLDGVTSEALSGLGGARVVED